MLNKVDYIGSELWKSIEYINDFQQLSNKARYIQMAISSHEREGDIEQMNFFIKAREHFCEKCSGIREATEQEKKEIFDSFK